MTFGYSPVMVEHLFDEALIWALRHGRDQMTWSDVMDAKMTAEVGLPNAGITYTPDERRAIATHEAGHATARTSSASLASSRSCRSSSARTRSACWGTPRPRNASRRRGPSWPRCSKISLAGMCAEEIFEGEKRHGAGGRPRHATAVACEMIGSLGMGDSLISFRAATEGLLDPGLVGRVIGNPETKKAVEALLKREKREIKALLVKHENLVMALRDALLDRDELIGDQIVEVLEAAGGKPASKTELRRAMARPQSRTVRAASTKSKS